MSILDKLRPQPDWKHDDPGVRIAAVQRLADEDADDILLQIVKDDADTQVRQAAIEQLDDPQLLSAIVREETNEVVRATAIAMLLDVVTSTDDLAIGTTVLAVLTDPHDLIDVARAAVHESIAHDARTRVTEVRSLSGVARRAGHASVRLEALSRIGDGTIDELIAVAVKSEHKDVALAALERLVDASRSNTAAANGLVAIASRAKCKVTGRRAKVVLRQREVATAAGADDEAERQEICARLEALGDSEDWSVVTDGLREAESVWAKLARADQVEGSLPARFTVAMTVLKGRLDAHYRAQAEQVRQREAHDAEAKPRILLCERVERAEGEQVLTEIESVKVDWSALPVPKVLSPEEASALARRFDEGCAALVRRHERIDEILAWRQQIAGDLKSIETKVTAGSLDEVSSAWRPLKKAWPPLEGAWTDELRARVRAVDHALRTNKEAARASDTRRRRANLAQLTQRCGQLETLVVSDAMTLKQAERGYRDVHAAVEQSVALPTKQDREVIEARLKALQRALYAKLYELREIDSWKRWANVNVQEELCRRVEALTDVEDFAEVSSQLRKAVAQWKAAATVPRERATELWQRFKTAHDQAYARCATYFAEQAEIRKANLKKKTALCEQVEALASSTDWVTTAARIVALQAEWKTIGVVPRKHSTRLWERFRGACDQFFNSRKADLAQRKKVWAKNYEQKEALCEQAEALAESATGEAIETVIRLESDWRKIGLVKRSKSDAIWKRFRAACAKVSAKLAEQEEAAMADALAEREAMCVDLEALLPTGLVVGGEEVSPTPPERLADQVKAVRQRWQKASGLPHRQAKDLSLRFQNSVGKLVASFPEAFRSTDLDPQKNRQRMDQLCTRVEKLLTSEDARIAGEWSPAELLAKRWREALAANTMGEKVDPAAERHAHIEEVKRAKAEWKRLTPLHGEEGQRLSERFKKACDRFFAQRKRPPATPSRQTG